MDTAVRARCILVFAAILAFGCGDEETLDSMVSVDAASASDGMHINLTPPQDMGIPTSDVQQSTECTAEWTFSDDILTLRCATDEVRFQPEIFVDGAWRNPQACEVTEESAFICAFEHGELVLERDQSVWRPQFTANTALHFDGFRLRGEGTLEEAKSWLSNGFQSWSQSGQLSLSSRYPDNRLKTALDAQGDIEVARSGNEFSWWMSYVVAKRNLLAGAISAERFKTWIQMNQEDETFHCVITSGQTGDKVRLASGQIIHGEGLWISLNADLTSELSAYADALPNRMPRRARPEAGWNSWYELWDNIDAADILENARIVPNILDSVVDDAHKPYRIVVDDGWQIEWGNWRANDGFPDGMAQIATQLRDEGFLPGIWMAPLLVESASSIVQDHPEWFLPQASFNHLAHGEMRILDVTEPNAENFLRESVAHVVEAGFDLLKIDFLFAGTYTSQRHVQMPAMAAYRKALSIIREAAGEDTVVLAVGAPPIAGFDLVDAWRVGPDVAVEAFDASWFYVQSTARSTAARWPFCVHTLCDGDPALLRGLPQAEVVASAWIAGLAGGAFFLSDDLRRLAPERLNWLNPEITAQGLSGKVATPREMTLKATPGRLTPNYYDQAVQRATHQVPLVWSLHDGRTFFLNVTDEPVSSEDREVPPRTFIIE